MKKYFLLLATTLTITVAFSQNADTKSAAIKKMLRMSGSAEMGAEIMNYMISSFKTSYPSAGNKFWEEFEKELNTEDMLDLIVPIYAKYYSEEEIGQLIAFYNTPLGKKLIQNATPIVKESMIAGQEWGTRLGEKIAKRLQAAGYQEQRPVANDLE